MLGQWIYYYGRFYLADAGDTIESRPFHLRDSCLPDMSHHHLCARGRYHKYRMRTVTKCYLHVGVLSMHCCIYVVNVCNQPF